MSDRDVLQAALAEALRFAEPVLDAARGPSNLRRMFAGAGWDLNAIAGLDVDALGEAVSETVEVAEDLVELADGGPQDFDAITRTIGNVADAVQAIDMLADTMKAPLQLSDEDALALAGDLLDFLAVRYLQMYRPVALSVLVLIGLADEPARASPPQALVSQPGRVPIRRPRLTLGRLPDLIEDPVEVLRDRWLPEVGGERGLATQQSADALADLLFPRVADLARAVGADAVYGTKQLPGVDFGAEGNRLTRRALTTILRVPLPIGGDDEGDLDAGVDVATELAVGATFLLNARDGAGLGLVVQPHGEVTLSVLFPRWAFALEVGTGTTQTGTPLGFAISKSGVEVPQGMDPAIDVDLTVERRRASGAAAVVLGAEGTRIELGSVVVGAGGTFSPSTVDPRVRAEVLDARVVVKPGDGDSFLRAVLPPDGLEVPFELGVRWSRSEGLAFTGGASLEVDLPVNVDLGFLRIPEINLSLGLDERGVQLGLGATADLMIGPLSATIERMGVAVAVSPPPSGQRGSAGPVDLALEFLPPKGIGFGVDAGPVAGGGYLFLDFDAGEYAGVLHLEIGPVSATAVGLLQTKLPGPVDGFSLVVIISASFPPIQLGYGFTLNGLGGILGVNRAMNVDALRDGIRSGAAGSLMFPEDPVRNARQIVADVGAIFPAAQDEFVFGPMIKMGWGTDTLITGTLAIVIQVPSLVIAIIGRLQVALPAEDAAVLLLRVDIVGVFDLGRKEISVDGTIQGSRVAAFPIEGDFALRLNFGQNAAFALSAGGFHPRYAPPPGFPTLRRLAISLAAGDNPRLRLECYMALTPATLQFGARAELYASVDLGLVGFFEVDAEFAFDVLIQFDPFGLEARLHVHACVRRNHKVFAGVELDGILRGPEPWELEGKAKVKVAFIEHTIRVRRTIGERRATPPPPVVAIAELVRAVLGEPGSWQAVLPELDAGVRVREAPPGSGLLAHPLGQLEVRQNRAPLSVTLEKVGEGTISGPAKLELQAIRLGQQSIANPDAISDMFAPGQYFAMSDEQRLTAPSFEDMPSGARATADNVAGFGTITFTPAYEERVIDEPDKPSTVVRRAALDAKVLRHALLGGPAGDGRAARAVRFAGPSLGIAVEDGEWAVVDASAGATKLAGSVLSVHSTAAEARAASRGKEAVVVLAGEAAG